MSSSQGGKEVPPLSSVDPNIYILSEAIRSSMESSMEILATTMQKNTLIMANTIQEGFVSGNSLAEEPRKKQARTSIEVAHGDSLGSSRKKNPDYDDGGSSYPNGGGFAKSIQEGRGRG